MNSVRITAPTVSQAVREFLESNSIGLDLVSANLVGEKIFTDKREYTVELSKKSRVPDGSRPAAATPEETDYAKSVLIKLLNLMRFTDHTVTIGTDNEFTILSVSTRGKDGLLIGKNGQNIIALQYLMSIALDKNLKRHVPVIIDVDGYRDKRVSYLKSFVRTTAEKVAGTASEAITDFLPSYERKLIHEELKSGNGVKTFSIGKGPYKKVVITSLL